MGCWGVVMGGDRGIYIYVAELRSWFCLGWKGQCVVLVWDDFLIAQICGTFPEDVEYSLFFFATTRRIQVVTPQLILPRTSLLPNWLHTRHRRSSVQLSSLLSQWVAP